MLVLKDSGICEGHLHYKGIKKKLRGTEWDIIIKYRHHNTDVQCVSFYIYFFRSR